MAHRDAAAIGGSSDTTPVRISYILSTRNRADHLDSALANIREYITPQDELVIVDGASTDHTAQVVEKHRDIVGLFLSQPDCGEAHGFNRGILASRGRYIKPLTDDDYFYPQAMHEAISIIEKHPEVDAFLCGGEMYTVNPETGEQRFETFLHCPPGVSPRQGLRVLFGHVGCGLGLWLSRTAIERVGLFDTAFLCVDTDYFGRLVDSTVELRYLNVRLYRHVRHLHSGSRNRGRSDVEALRILIRHRQWEATTAYSPQNLAEALGLNAVPGGPAAAKILWCIERLRQSRLRFLLWPLAIGLTAGVEGGRVCSRAMRRLGLVRASQLLPPSRSAGDEPQWDGSLQ